MGIRYRISSGTSLSQNSKLSHIGSETTRNAELLQYVIRKEQNMQRHSEAWLIHKKRRCQ